MSRLNVERQERLEPLRLEGVKQTLEGMGYKVALGCKSLSFNHKGGTVTVYPYTGWFTGKTVTDGRGFSNLLRQIKEV